MSWRATGAGLAVLAAAWACGNDSGPNGLVAFIGIDGLPAADSVFVGGHYYIVANTYDADHHLVTRADLSWASSDTTVLALYPGSSAASLEARKPGTARLTIRSEGATFTADIVVRDVPVATVTLTPTDPAGYVGATMALQATIVDAFGNVRTDRHATWTSDNPNLLQVDSTGVLTMVGAGTASIRATCDAAADTVSVLSLPHPTLDWSQVTTEWTTYQGNASHTGYIPAVLDPVQFTPRWSVSLATGSSLTPATAGGGHIYVSTDAYFGQQLLYTIDAATGAIQWSYDFGQIHSVDPPAYADGSVYVATGGQGDSYLWSFDASTGGLRFHTGYGNQWSRYMAPVIDGQTLYMAGGTYGGMYAFNTSDGSTRWFLGLNQYDNFTPAVRGGMVYAYTGLYTPEVTVADASTGAAIDHIPDPAFNWIGWSMDASPVLGSGETLLTTQSGRLLSFDLTNHQIGWSLTGAYAGQLSLANGIVYVQNGPTIDARRESDGGLLWSVATPPGLQGPMLVTQNLLLLSSATTTWAADLTAHRIAWSYPVGGQLALTQDGLLLIAGWDGKLTAIQVN